MPWADKNFAQAEEQILVKEATARPSIATVAAEGDKPEVMMTKASDIITIKGNGYTAQFDIQDRYYLQSDIRKREGDY